MWQEARKHERKLRGMMVDYKRRGERRREYYEKIKKDPAQFLQVHGRAYKIHLDSAVALAAESPANMMPWQGDANNMIDRFDVRAHLDYIPTYTPPLLNTVTPEQESEERKCNYERYRGLVQNDFASISEEQCLYQIYLDELYGGLPRPNEDEKKKLAEKKASIGYTYEDSTVTEPSSHPDKGEADDDSENSESDEDEGIPDIDVEVDVDELNQEQVQELNKMATPYGMADGDFVRMLRKDKEEVEAIKHAKALEAEKAMYSGRRSRRQRREFREKRLKGRQISPPSYARRDSPTYDPYKRPQSESSSESRSRSRSPGQEKITFITSFGGSDDEGAPAAPPQPAAHASHAPSNSQQHHPAGHSRGSRRRRSSSSVSSTSSSSSSRSSSRRSSSRSSSRSRRSRRRGGRDSRYSRSRSRSRRSDSRSRGRGGGNSGARRRYARSRSRSRSRSGDRDRGRRHTVRRRTRSRSDSRTGDRFRRQGRSSGPRRGGSSSASPTQSPGLSRSPSPPPRHAPPTAMALCDKLRKPDTAGGKETGAAKVTQDDAPREAEAAHAEGPKQAMQGG
ncbi:CLK4-associating serine/arginine rich protein isoform X3 [Scleropages formosus]|uniref:CLK4-associating serine/arginine rich protein isoform X3 n=1 Tax=Scleropages formosus TaxID=113540 RepID=UPI0010FA6D23|nr:CLK4-associating serine/arginine rich protein isoform X3 [Scleropages formosus]